MTTPERSDNQEMIIYYGCYPVSVIFVDEMAAPTIRMS